MPGRSDRLLAVAKRTFRRKGYRRTTMAYLGRALGILKGSLYCHIRSKEDLLYRIVSATGEAVSSRAKAIRRSDLPVAERLRSAIVSHIRFFQDDPDGMALFLTEVGSLKPPHRSEVVRIMRDYEGVLRALVQEGMKAGAFRADADPKIVVYGILGMCNWLIRWYDPRGPLSVEEVAEMLADLALRLRPSPVA